MNPQESQDLAFARDRLAGVASDLDDLRARARALVSLTRWRARAAEAYRAAALEWTGLLDALVVEVHLCEGEVAAAQARAMAGQAER